MVYLIVVRKEVDFKKAELRRYRRLLWLDSTLEDSLVNGFKPVCATAWMKGRHTKLFAHSVFCTIMHFQLSPTLIRLSKIIHRKQGTARFLF